MQKSLSLFFFFRNVYVRSSICIAFRIRHRKDMRDFQHFNKKSPKKNSERIKKSNFDRILTGVGEYCVVLSSPSLSLLSAVRSR
jgi:hypothetical protein